MHSCTQLEYRWKNPIPLTHVNIVIDSVNPARDIVYNTIRAVWLTLFMHTQPRMWYFISGKSERVHILLLMTSTVILFI